MKLFILLPSLFLLSFYINAQDIITLKNNNIQVQAKVISIEDEQINYKKFRNKKGTTFSIPISEVVKIVFESGEERIFNLKATEVDKVSEFTEEKIPEAIENKEDNVETEAIIIQEQQENLKQLTDNKNKFKMKLGLGGLVGANLTTIKYAYNNESIDLGNTYRASLSAGFMLEWEIWRVFSLYSALYYKDKGDKINGRSYVSDWEFPTDNPIVYTAEGDGNINKHLGYLEWSFMPLFAYTNASNSLQVQAGGGIYLALGLTGNEKVDMSITYYRNGEFDEVEEIKRTNSVVFVQEQIVGQKLPDTQYFNMLDYGFMFYIGVKPRPFIANLQLALGKANTSSLSIEDIFTSGENIKTSKNLTITLAFGYIL